MTMRPGVRNLALTAHVTASVGWLGAVAGFLALAVAGLVSAQAHVVQAAYVGMELTGWFVIVPLSVASLATGLVQSLGTPWGVFRHYWVVAKLLINVVATALLLLHMQPTSRVAAAAADGVLGPGDLRPVRIQLVADAGGALLVLLVATALGVYKPRGLTPYGLRKLREGRTPGIGAAAEKSTPRWAMVFGIVVLGLVLLVVIVHLAGGGLGGH